MIKREDIKIGYRIYRNDIPRMWGARDPTIDYYAIITGIRPITRYNIANTCEIEFSVEWENPPETIPDLDSELWAAERYFWTLTFWGAAP